LKRRRLGSVPVRGGNVSVHAGVSDETAHLGCAGDRSRCSLRLPTAEGLTRVSIAVSVPAGPAPVGEPLPIAVTVRNRGSRPALDVRTCVRLPRGLGLARSGGATLRNGESVGGLPGLRRELVASSGSRARQLRARLTNGQHHRPWRQRAPPHRADPTPDRLRGAAPALHRLTTVAPARRGRF
jgi:hypothetical protein